MLINKDIDLLRIYHWDDVVWVGLWACPARICWLVECHWAKESMYTQGQRPWLDVNYLYIGRHFKFYWILHVLANTWISKYHIYNYFYKTRQIAGNPKSPVKWCTVQIHYWNFDRPLPDCARMRCHLLQKFRAPVRKFHTPLRIFRTPVRKFWNTRHCIRPCPWRSRQFHAGLNRHMARYWSRLFTHSFGIDRRLPYELLD